MEAVMGWLASFLTKEGGGAMDTYQVISLLLLSGNFLIALLSYIHNTRK